MNFKKYFYFKENNDLKKHVRNYSSASDFLKSQYTGYIQSNAYDGMNFFKKIENCPKLIKILKISTGEEIEFRQTGEKLKYTKTDKNGNIERDNNGSALFQSDDEIKQNKLPKEETTVYAFNSKKENIGYASDEWGADGVWVKPEYQKQGIGTELLILLKQQVGTRKIGQMTNAGINMTRSYWRKLTGNKKPDINNILNKYKEFIINYNDNDKFEDKEDLSKASEAIRAWVRFFNILTPDEQYEFNNYFYPKDFNQIISPEDFYEKYKKRNIHSRSIA